MKAKFTMFTHFSARYGRIPVFDDCDYKNNKIGFAYDFMYLNPSNFHRTLEIVDKLKVAFKLSDLENNERLKAKQAKRYLESKS